MPQAPSRSDTADGLVFIDPLEPPPELGRPDHVLLTVYWHGPLLELPVEQVLVSHGAPVVHEGLERLQAIL